MTNDNGNDLMDDNIDIESDVTDTNSTSADEGYPETKKTEETEEGSVTSRERLRIELEEQMQEFLKRGGQIEQVESNVTADPPKKPSSNYGSRPI